MIQYKGINIFTSEYISKDKLYKTEERLIIHPYNLGTIMLNDWNKTYYDVFSHLGVDKHSIDCCVDYALKKIQDFIDNYTV